MITPSLSLVAALFVTYILARIIDARGRGGVFLPVLPLAFLFGESIFPAVLFTVLISGSLLSLIDATRGGLDKR